MTDSNKEREMYNRMRYLVFLLYVGEKAQSYEKARKLIDFLCDKYFNGQLDEDGKRKMSAGLVAELKFFHVLKDKLSLVPTLDAGCRYDFIGRLMEEVMHIDVAKSLDFKESVDSDVVIAEVLDSNAGVSFAGGNVRSCRTTGYSLPSLADCPWGDAEFCQFVQAHSSDVNFAIDRGIVLRAVVVGEPLEQTVTKISEDSTLTEPVKQQLIAHAIFQHSYGQAYGLVLALSCGDGIDFVGCRDNKVTRYLVASDAGACDDRRISFLRDAAVMAKVALFSTEKKTFSFQELDAEIFEPDIQ